MFMNNSFDSGIKKKDMSLIPDKYLLNNLPCERHIDLKSVSEDSEDHGFFFFFDKPPPRPMWDLSPLTRDLTHAPCSGNVGCQGSPVRTVFLRNSC